MKAINYIYFIAYSLTIIAILAGQLIWLPAPLFNSIRWDWIAVINGLYYSVLLIPLSFVTASSCLAVSIHKQIKLRPKQIVIPSLVYIAALYSIYNIVMHQYVQAIIGLLLLIAFATIFYIMYRVKLDLISTKRLTLLSLSYIVCMTIIICPIPYNVTYPFFTFNMQTYAQITAIQNQPLQQESNKNIGKVDGVLVADRPAFIVDLLYAKLFNHIDLTKHTGSQMPITEIYSQVVSQKLGSNQLASAYAWQLHSGEQVIVPRGVRIIGILEHSHAKKSVHAGDIIVNMQGKPIYTITDLTEVMSSISVDENITMTVETDEQLKEVIVRASASQTDSNKAALGIYIEQAVTVNEPLSVNYIPYTAHFGGPSHGAMLTIALLDQLQHGKLVGNKHIAGTGTIEIDGSIGMVGGIKQKAYAVSRSEADVFFVPERAVELAKQGAPGLHIVGVSHILEIINWLAENNP